MDDWQTLDGKLLAQAAWRHVDDRPMTAEEVAKLLACLTPATTCDRERVVTRES